MIHFDVDLRSAPGRVIKECIRRMVYQLYREHGGHVGFFVLQIDRETFDVWFCNPKKEPTLQEALDLLSAFEGPSGCSVMPCDLVPGQAIFCAFKQTGREDFSVVSVDFSWSVNPSERLYRETV